MADVAQLRYLADPDNQELQVRPVLYVWGLDLYGSLEDSVSRFWDCLKGKTVLFG